MSIILQLKEAKKLFLQKAGIKIVTYLMIVVAAIFLFAGFFYLYQQKLTWDSNAITISGETVQAVYKGNFSKFMLDSFVVKSKRIKHR